MTQSNATLLKGVTLVAIFYYVMALMVAEIIALVIGIIPAVIYHAILVPLLLTHYVVKGNNEFRRLLPALAVASLMRILSFTIPTITVPQIFWYVLIGIPFLATIILTARLLDLSPARLGLHLRRWPVQLWIATTGVPLSTAGYLVLRPAPVTSTFDAPSLLVSSVILIIFIGFTEELFFRGVLQAVAEDVFGRWGILCSSAIFIIMYIASLSVSYTIFMGIVGLFFAYCVSRTGSIWGVVGAHSILSLGMGLGLPYVAQYDAMLLSTVTYWGLLGGWGLALVAIAATLWPAFRTKK